jgi:TolA-binding protein
MPTTAPRAETSAAQEPPLPPSSVTPRASKRSRPGEPRQYALEVNLLEPARSSVVRGQYDVALAAIARHQREFPNGQLAEEREALRVRALWGQGQKPAAAAAAASFRNRYPRSLLLSWMKAQPGP